MCRFLGLYRGGSQGKGWFRILGEDIGGDVGRGVGRASLGRGLLHSCDSGNLGYQADKSRERYQMP